MAIMAILDKNADYGHDGHTGKNILYGFKVQDRIPEVQTLR